MRVPLTAILSYYRNSLADADRMAPDDALIQTALTADANEWTSAQLSRDNITLLWNARSSTGKAEMDEWGRRRFWYCPWVGTLKPEHGAMRHGLPNRLVPLWVPVRVSENGGIEPDPVLLPWIPRNLLDPIYPARLVLGNVSDADTYVAANTWEEPEPTSDETSSEYRARKMQAWLDYGYKLVEFVTKKDWASFGLDEYYQEPSGVALPAGVPSAKISGLLAHYDALIRDKITTPPLQRFIIGDGFPSVDPLASNDDPRALHIAHIPGFPTLSEDQRGAMHQALVHHPDVLAVHGPPGTGKTKWIAELALQPYVEAALNEEPNPPVQMWVAGTNQAIFSSLQTLRGEIQELRWAYPGVRGLGIWCAAKSQQRENLQQDHDWLGFKWVDGLPEGSPSLWGSEDAVVEAKQLYQDQAQKYFGQFMELSDIKARILDELRKSVNPLRSTWRLLRRDRARKQATDKLLVQAQWPTEFEEYLAHLQALVAKRKKALERANYILAQWHEHVETTPIWITLTASLPGAAGRFLTRNKNFFKRFNLTPRGADLSDNDSVTKALIRLVKDIEVLCKQTDKQWQETRRIRQEKEEISKAWVYLSEQWLETPRWHDDGTIDPLWDSRCDNVHRSNATMWALRYWEAVFIERRIAYYQDTRSGRMRSKFEGWKELACLTPMLAMTLHTAPRYFQEGNDDRDMRPMYGFAHRIVLEESSQLSPDIITGLLSYARSAVFVGDEKQLLPIWSVPEKTDMGNLLQQQLMTHTDQLEEWKESELMASCGSALLRAKQAGYNVYLKEQHRSHPDLVAFANRLCYNNTIVPTRTDNDPDWPAFAYGHVVGVVDNQLASKGNRIEAQAIAQYLLRMSSVIKQKYGVSRLGDALAVVTPFVRQVQWLRQEFQRRLPAEDIPSVGTVHAYQGSEKPIMVFSAVQSVYGQETAFFDIDTTMLNVAVSRSRDAFWYIGNMNGMHQKGLKPSAILAQSLIKGSYQRLHQWSLPFDAPHDLPISQPASTDEKNKILLIRSFLEELGAGTLHIASPTFNAEYMEAIDFWSWARTSIAKGGNIVLHGNRTIMTYHGDGSASDLVRMAASQGIQWNWHSAVFDSRIWTPNRMAECSMPWFVPLNTGTFVVYEGSVQLWCQAQLGSWGTLIKGSMFGNKIDEQ